MVKKTFSTLERARFAGYFACFVQNKHSSIKLLLKHFVPLVGYVRSKCVASVPSPLLTEGNYQMQDCYHLPVRYGTSSSEVKENNYKEMWPVVKRQR
jgi:hypothetical protein